MNETKAALPRIIRLFQISFAIAFIAALTFHNVKSQSSDENASRIAFVNDINVYVMKPDGSDRTQLTNVEPGPANHPSWSPDSRKIAFDTMVSSSLDSSAFNTDVFVIDIHSLETINLTNSAFEDLFPVWSPKGDQIAFVSNRDGNWDVYLMDTNGENQINLTQDEANDGIHGLTWSPDGSKIAFVSDRNEGRDIDTGHYEVENIYVIDVPMDTQNLEKPKAYNLTSQIDECSTGEFYLNPSWSVENRLAFALSCGRYWDIFVFNVDDAMNHAEGFRYFNLTDRPNADGVLGLSWSPDGNIIIFVSNPDSDKSNDQEIFLLDVPKTAEISESEIVQLTNDPNVSNYYAFPVWEMKVFMSVDSTPSVP